MDSIENQMHELENILKDILPKTKKQEEKEIISDKDIHHLVNGSYLSENKKIFLVEYLEKLPLNFGNIKIEDFQIPPIINKWAGIQNRKLEDLVFLDTETTGLAGGTGTLVFLVGIGFFRENNFIVKQYFMSEPASEIFLINALEDEFRKFSVFVSFNGKSFDIPLLKTRFILNQKKLNKMGNLDLLHLSRRLWKNSLKNCTLQNLEKEILNKQRDLSNDIPGSEIPQVYFHYLENRDAALLKNVFHHNKIDIISLAALLVKISEILQFSKTGENPFQNNLFEIGRLFEDCEDHDSARDIFEIGLKKHPQNAKCLKQLSFLYKKRGQIETAEKLWLTAAELNEIYAFIELAKIEEHRRHNYKKALQYTKKAIALVKQSYIFEMSLIDELVHRYQRLEKKIELTPSPFLKKRGENN